MLCDACSQIPLEAFLRRPGHPLGNPWHGNKYILYDGPGSLDQLYKSSIGGCSLCTTFRVALDGAEPFWAMQKLGGESHRSFLDNSRDDQEQLREAIQLKVSGEGELLIVDGHRIAYMHWRLEELGFGKRYSEIRACADCNENFSMAKEWLEICTRHHKACGMGTQGAFLPTRLIDIGDPNLPGIRPRLIISNRGLLLEGAQYLALSHCWGSDRGKTVPKTTTKHFKEHLERIDTRTLPKTFLDFLEVARRLGFRYVWIDSLCIIQDDIDDFRAECSKMDQVYSGAHCTIVASDGPSDSADADGGCFLARDVNPVKFAAKRRYTPLECQQEGHYRPGPEEAEVTIYPNFGPWFKTILQGTVFGRGWCLQERELSPRVLHFTKDRILWECRTCTASEDEPQMESKEKNKSLASHLSSFRVLDDPDLYTYSILRNAVQKRVHKWNKLVEAYSQRRLSVATDKLPAISGIAAAVGRRQPGDMYLAGIWRNNLLEGISWFPQTTSKQKVIPAETWPPSPTDNGTPSWSWAAHDGPIAFYGDSWFGGAWATIIGTDGEEEWVKRGPEIEVKGASVVSDSIDPYGRVSGGEIVLEGWAADVTVDEDCLIQPSEASRHSKDPVFSSKCYSGRLYGVPRLTIYLDDDVDALPVTRVCCLQLGTGMNVRGTYPKSDTGLVLMSVALGSPVARRIGMFDISGDKSGWQAVRQKRLIRIV